MQVLVLELKNIVDFCHAVIIDVASVACGAGSMKGLSVSPSVCPIDQQQQWCVAGLLLIAPRAGDVQRYQAANGQQQRHCSTALSTKCMLTVEEPFL